MAFIDCRTLTSREVAPGFHGRFVHGHAMTLAMWEIDPGSGLPDHAHVHEQIVMVLSGEFELTVAGEKKRLTPGIVAVVPSNVPHSGRAITKCQVIDAFHPVRDDYR
jgi:quercetin dioxygenase-like cupin family protein